MSPDDELRALREAHRRLRIAAENLIADCEAAGTPAEPRSVVPAYRVRALRRELRGEPAPSSVPFSTMSVS